MKCARPCSIILVPQITVGHDFRGGDCGLVGFYRGTLMLGSSAPVYQPTPTYSTGHQVGVCQRIPISSLPCIVLDLLQGVTLTW